MGITVLIGPDIRGTPLEGNSLEIGYGAENLFGRYCGTGIHKRRIGFRPEIKILRIPKILLSGLVISLIPAINNFFNFTFLIFDFTKIMNFTQGVLAPEKHKRKIYSLYSKPKQPDTCLEPI